MGMAGTSCLPHNSEQQDPESLVRRDSRPSTRTSVLPKETWIQARGDSVPEHAGVSGELIWDCCRGCCECGCVANLSISTSWTQAQALSSGHIGHSGSIGHSRSRANAPTSSGELPAQEKRHRVHLHARRSRHHNRRLRVPSLARRLPPEQARRAHHPGHRHRRYRRRAQRPL